MELLQQYAYKFFPATKYMDYAVKVEAYTLGKAANLVLNVDGCIGALFLDLLNSSSQFTHVSFCLPLPTSRSLLPPSPHLALPRSGGTLRGARVLGFDFSVPRWLCKLLFSTVAI